MPQLSRQTDDGNRAALQTAAGNVSAAVTGGADPRHRRPAQPTDRTINGLAGTPAIWRSRLAFVVVGLVIATGTPAWPLPFLCGDADGDRVVTVRDGVHVLRAAAGMPGGCQNEPFACDLDGDGTLTLVDGVATLSLAAALATSTNCRRALPGDESLARIDVRLAGCERVTREAQYCLTFATHLDSRGSTLAVLGLESGKLCDVQALGLETDPWDVSSLGWRGEVVYACTGGGVIRISTRDGTQENVSIACQAATADENGILVMSPLFPFHPRNVSAHAGYDSLLADRVLQSYDFNASTRIAVSGERVFGAWHSTHQIDVRDRATAAAFDAIPLERYDDWVNGFAVTGDGDLVISRWGSDSSTVTIFDAETGARKREWQAPAMLNGLVCATERRGPE